MDSALAEIKAALEVPDESMANLEGYVAKWVEDDHGRILDAEAAASIGERARERRKAMDAARDSPVVSLETWRGLDDDWF